MEKHIYFVQEKCGLIRGIFYKFSLKDWLSSHVECEQIASY